MKKRDPVEPNPPVADDPMDTLRRVSQPQRDLVRILHQQFSAGRMKPGGKVIVMRGKK
jgi:hypothetical protein